jgi:hypothetical protein
MPVLEIVPITFRAASVFVAQNHRHNRPPRGHKFSIGLKSDGVLAGVAMCGRPISRHEDDGLTIEVNRTCTDGTSNANSMLYGASWRAAKAMGYRRIITYTQLDESGASLRAAGFIRLRDLPKRKGWSQSTKDERLVEMRDLFGSGGVDRVLWGICL